jgi:Tfp pilus assembly protein PilF
MNFHSRLWKRSLAPASLAALFLVTAGCMRQVTVRDWLGTLRPQGAVRAMRRVPAVLAGKRQAPPRYANPDEVLRETFRTQARGAFNPLTDDRQIGLLQARLRLDPQDIQARLDLAAAYERYKLYEQALDQYTRALNLSLPVSDRQALETDSKAAARAEAAAAGIGRTARQAAQGAAASPVLAAFLKTWPQAAAVWNELGLLQEQAGDRAAAEQSFRRAVLIFPKSSRFRSNLGYNLLEQGHLAGAEAELRRAVALDQNSATARNNLGTVLARRGDFDGARRQFLAVADAATAHNNLAVVLIEMEQYDQGREELIKALAARNYFAAAMDNFKLVQQLLRQREEIARAGRGLPLSTVRLPALAREIIIFAKEETGPLRPENRP